MEKGRWDMPVRLVALAGVVALGLAVPAAAQDVKIVDPSKGGALSNDDLDALLAPPGEPASGGPKTRQIMMGGAKPSAPAGSGAAAQPQRASAPAVRPDATSGGAVIGVPVQFALDSAEVPPEFVPILRQIGERMAQMAGAVLVIEGHTDASGGAAYNLELSRRRASSVRDWLISNYGIDAGRVKAVGRGEADPLPGMSPSDPTNRRVQFRAGS